MIFESLATELLANVGFPIFISVYLMVRIENKIENVSVNTQRLFDRFMKEEYRD
ncbi:YvrJ family protein [Alteribacillus sp. HJP-4]|uniref:YvrJ family protein n=1 Tax=Alteribacillus sp. HJP-4 TaxID=2775394 RepID=UPI0035CD0470